MDTASQQTSSLAASDVDHSMRARVRRQGEPVRSSGTYQRYWQLFGDIPGWFEPPAIAAWDALLQFQTQSGVQGNLLEIGVWQGKSAAMMALHCRANEICVLVDWGPLEEPIAKITRSIPSAKCIGVRLSSDEFSHTRTAETLKHSVRWIHIDGGHSADQVVRDLTLADTLLASSGLLVVDDFFSPGYPQVTEAVFRTMHNRPKSFTLILAGFNKAYLCRPAAAVQYREFIRDCMYQEMKSRDCGSVSFWKTNGHAGLNTFGMVPNGDDKTPYRGLDTNHEEIQI